MTRSNFLRRARTTESFECRGLPSDFYSDHDLGVQDLSRDNLPSARGNGFYDLYYANPADQTQDSLNFYTVPTNPNRELPSVTPPSPSPPMSRSRRRDGMIFEHGLPELRNQSYDINPPRHHHLSSTTSSGSDSLPNRSLYGDTRTYNHPTHATMGRSSLYGEYDLSQSMGRGGLDYSLYDTAEPHEVPGASYGYRSSTYQETGRGRSQSFDQRNSYMSTGSYYIEDGQSSLYHRSERPDSFSPSQYLDRIDHSYSSYVEPHHDYIDGGQGYTPLRETSSRYAQPSQHHYPRRYR